MRIDHSDNQNMTWYKTGLMAASGFFIGFFLAMRFSAFLQQAWDFGLHPCFSWAAALFFLTASIALRSLIHKIWIGAGIPPWAAAVLATLSLLFCLAARQIINERAILGSEIQIGFISGAAMTIGAGLLLTLFLILLYQGLSEIWAGIRNWAKALTRKDFIFAVLILAILNALSVLYVKNSATIYFWDNAGYWATARMLADLSGNGIFSMLSAVYSSILTADYNYLIALPLVPIVRSLGPSRLVFILSIVNLYLFPLLLLVYGLAKRSGRHPFMTAVAVSCSLPFLFYLSLLGFIDIAGTFFALAAMALCMRPLNRKSSSCWRPLLAGCFLAVAVLLRRWYVFFVLSLILAQLATALICRKNIARPLWTCGAFAFILLFFFQPMVSGLLLADYASAYSAYSMTIRVDFMLLFRYFGIFTLLLSLLSFGFGLRDRQSSERVIFTLIQPLLCFFLFTRIQTHGQQHLLLYAPAVIMALLPLYAMLIKRAAQHKLAIAAVSLSALLPLLSPFLPRAQPKAVSEIPSAAILPSFSYAPPKRSDALGLVNIVRYLDETVGEQGKTVGVLASSFVLNGDILKNAEASLSLPRVSDVSRDYILALPAVDSRDSFPGALFDCDYLLTASPIQLHLGEENQHVVAIPAGALLNFTGFGAAYQPMDKGFFIGDGSVEVRLYEKMRPGTPAEEEALIAAIEAAVNGN